MSVTVIMLTFMMSEKLEKTISKLSVLDYIVTAFEINTDILTLLNINLIYQHNVQNLTCFPSKILCNNNALIMKMQEKNQMTNRD